VKKDLQQHFQSSMEITGSTGRTSSFEISAKIAVGDKQSQTPTVLWSKLSTGSFPDPNQIIQIIQRFAETGKGNIEQKAERK